ncbi:MAG: GIY-YIG nuclease family protein [Ignavibacteriales bacterium]|nr:GIY-YIG nuclease family protein [Ignavibacteriales bacterium]
MFYTYILFSEIGNKHYYGSTKDIPTRLNEHNNGKVKFTKPFRPWQIVYYEEYPTRSEACKRELFFKSVDGRIWLKNNRIL